MTIQENVVFQDCHTDECGTGLEKALAYIDSYNKENWQVKADIKDNIK